MSETKNEKLNTKQLNMKPTPLIYAEGHLTPEMREKRK